MSGRADVRNRRGARALHTGTLAAVLLLAGGLLGPTREGDQPARPDEVVLEVAAPRCGAEPTAPLEVRLREHPAAGRPESVRIPELGVTVPVVAVSMTDGVLVPPPDPFQLGWWDGGAVPGARRGTAVVTGHTVSNGDGALDELHQLSTGDRVHVRTVDGRIVYRVSAVVHYTRAELARVAGQVFSQRVPGQLVLTTCTDFDGREYLGNTLVFARPEH